MMGFAARSGTEVLPTCSMDTTGTSASAITLAYRRRRTPAWVREWHADFDPNSPTSRAHAYALLKAILTSAMQDDLIDANPCRIRGASKVAMLDRPGAFNPDSDAQLRVVTPVVLLAVPFVCGCPGMRAVNGGSPRR